MFERDRYYGLALGGACLAFAAIILVGWSNFNSYQAQHAYERQKVSEYQAFQSTEKAAVCSAPTVCVNTLTRVVPNPDAKTPDYPAYFDLKAQQDMSEWTYSLLWVGILGLIATVVGIGFVYENLREMRRQSGIQKDVGENQVKAYLWVSEASLHLRSLEPAKGLLSTMMPAVGRNATIILKVVNNGQTPALDISANAILSASKFSKHNALAGVAPPRFTANSTSDSKVDAVMAGDTEPDLFLFFPFEREDEVANALSADWAVKYGVENIHIAGSVTYKDVFGHTYESEFAFNGLVKETNKFETMHRVKKGKVMFRKVKDASDEREPAKA